MKNNKIAILLILLLTQCASVLAENEKASILGTKDEWIHYDRSIIEGSFSTVTPIGLVEIQAVNERGYGKVFSELNIGGFGRVSRNPWKKFSAKALGLKYGVKLDLHGGEFTGGVGTKVYDGSTNCQVDGCKNIEYWGWGATGKFERPNGDFIQTDYKHKTFTPTQWHPLTVSPFPLTQDTTLKINNLDILAKTGSLLYEISYLGGSKRDVYSILVPKNKLSFDKVGAGFFPEFLVNKYRVSIGPTFCAGTAEGSIAQLDVTNCIGGKLSINHGNNSFNITLNTQRGNGMASFAEFDIMENLRKQKITVDITSGKWSLEGYLSKETHVADLNIFDPTLTFIVNGSKHTNKRIMKEYGVSVDYIISNKTTINASLKGVKANGAFYTNPRLDEDGHKISLGLTHSF